MNDDKQSLTDDTAKQSLPSDEGQNNQNNDPVIPSNSEESQDLKTEEPRDPSLAESVQDDKSVADQNQPQAENTETPVQTKASSSTEEAKSDAVKATGEVEQPVIASEARANALKQSDSEKEIATEPAAPRNDEQKDESSNDNPNAKWYVVHTYSGHENKVAVTLKQRIDSEHLQEKILDVLVPVQDKIEIKGGKKITIKEKIFPGYILVKMVLDDASWLAVRTTQGVTSFVGMGNKPTPISEAEVQTIVRFTQEEAPVYKQVFSADDTVKIVDGPFADFIGKVDSVDGERGKVKVLVSIFGRETPVELDFLQVQKI